MPDELYRGILCFSSVVSFCYREYIISEFSFLNRHDKPSPSQLNKFHPFFLSNYSKAKKEFSSSVANISYNLMR